MDDMDGSRPEWGPKGSFPGAAGANPARLVEDQTQDAPDPYLPGSEGTEGADRHEAGNVSQGDNSMYALAVQDRKEAPEQPRTRRLFTAGRITPTPHALYVLGILEDAIARSRAPSEVTGYLLEVAERATVEGDHSHAAALREAATRIFDQQPARVEVWEVAL